MPRCLPRNIPFSRPIYAFPVPKKEGKHLCTPTHAPQYADLISYISLTLFAWLSLIAFAHLYSRLQSMRMVGTPRPPPPPSKLGTAFLPTLFPGISTLGTPPMVLGSFINETSS